jgi:hypothetical protein
MTAGVLTAQTALNKHLERRVWAAQVLEGQALIRPVPGRRACPEARAGQSARKWSAIEAWAEATGRTIVEKG